MMLETFYLMVLIKLELILVAIKNPPIITELMALFGRQCVVVAIDAKKNYEIKENTFMEICKKVLV